MRIRIWAYVGIFISLCGMLLAGAVIAFGQKTAIFMLPLFAFVWTKSLFLLGYRQPAFGHKSVVYVAIITVLLGCLSVPYADSKLWLGLVGLVVMLGSTIFVQGFLLNAESRQIKE